MSILLAFLGGGGTPQFDLAASEGADTAAFNVQEGFRLAASEGADTAAFTIQEGFRLAATEAADTAVFTLAEGANLTLSATEAADSVSFTIQEGFRLAASEGTDSAAFDVTEGTVEGFALAASESADVAAFSVEPAVSAVLPSVPIASGGWVGGGERGTTAIYGPLRQQKRKLRRLVEEAKEEDVAARLITQAEAAKTRAEIANALVAIEAALQRIAEDDDDEDWMMLAA